MLRINQSHPPHLLIFSLMHSLLVLNESKMTLKGSDWINLSNEGLRFVRGAGKEKC